MGRWGRRWTAVPGQEVPTTGVAGSRRVGGRWVASSRGPARDLADGYSYRSRSERNDARFLTYLGIPYEYETRRFMFPGVRPSRNSARLIDPDKWFGVEIGPEPTAAATEAIRRIQDGRLHLLYRAYGRTGSSSGSGRPCRELALIVQNSEAVTAIQDTMKVTAVATTGCQTNPDPTRPTAAWAAIGGRFFAAPTSGGEVTDVAAIIRLVRRLDATEPPNVLRMIAGVFHCDDSACTKTSQLFTHDFGPVKLRQTARLRVQWHPDNHRFIFQRDKAPEIPAPYTASDTAVPGISGRSLNATLFVPNCTAKPWPRAFIDAWFDDVGVKRVSK